MTTTDIDLDNYRSEAAGAILARLDTDHIDRIARNAAEHMAYCAAAVAVLVPGDATQYQITLVRTQDNVVIDTSDGARRTNPTPDGWNWLNVAVTPAGRPPYAWDATSPPHTDHYVLGHFTDDFYTAVVLGEFLQRFAVAYAAVVGDEAGCRP